MCVLVFKQILKWLKTRASHADMADIATRPSKRGSADYPAWRGEFLPLFVASQNGHIEEVRHLCEAGADKDRATHTGTTPLFIASEKGHIEVVRHL